MKKCPECGANINIPGKEKTIFCPFCGASLLYGSIVKSERRLFFLTPFVLLLLSLLVCRFLIDTDNPVLLASIFSGKLIICFFMGALTYAAASKLVKQPFNPPAFRQSGILAILLYLIIVLIMTEIEANKISDLNAELSTNLIRGFAASSVVPSVLSVLLAGISVLIQNKNSHFANSQQKSNPFLKNASFFVLIFISLVSIINFAIMPFHQKAAVSSFLLTRAGSPDKALKFLKEAHKEPNLSKTHNDFIHYLEGKIAADTLFKAEKPENAVKSLENALSSYPNSVLVKFYLSISHGAAGNSAEAVKYGEEAYKASNNNTVVGKLLGGMYIQQNKSLEAISVYNDILKHSAKDPTILNNLSYLLLEANQEIDRALELAKLSVTYAPNNITTLDTLAWAYYKNNKSSEALETIKPLAGYIEDYPEIKYHYVIIRNSMGLISDAEQQLKSILALPEVIINIPLSAKILKSLAEISVNSKRDENLNE